jgi:flap endonuclease-1
MAILIGTDFNEGVKGIGPRKSLQLIKKYETVEHVLSTLDGEPVLSADEITEIRSLFLEPKVIQEPTMQWSPPDVPGVLDYLCTTYQFSEERVRPVLKKFDQGTIPKKQQTLF